MSLKQDIYNTERCRVYIVWDMKDAQGIFFVLKGQRDPGETILADTFDTTTNTTDTTKMQHLILAMVHNASM